jgi:DNA-binding MarR family transcriptional regulator
MQGRVNQIDTLPAQMSSEVTTSGTIAALMRVSRRAYRLVRAHEDVLGMKLKSFIALNYLREEDPVTQRALGDTLMLDANNCVILLNELEQHGWVRRLRDPADRRRHIVELTPEGGKALERAEKALDQLEPYVLKGLGEDERVALHGLLRKAADG